ncbi:hypothetical protein L1987_66925 [Smallanthus sonchifolius]|uniref:Uncharacterized protein n=1 Tax=Smallanthus sonchifolius TaxID=185202 RepID=A0ACB9BYG0_9ASTR|nr:hypothetical protein L1987_66925 [Smallanthus sonchifolius]
MVHGPRGHGKHGKLPTTALYLIYLSEHDLQVPPRSRAAMNSEYQMGLNNLERLAPGRELHIFSSNTLLDYLKSKVNDVTWYPRSGVLISYGVIGNICSKF